LGVSGHLSGDWALSRMLALLGVTHSPHAELLKTSLEISHQVSNSKPGLTANLKPAPSRYL
jgi:hypothetical protein